MAKTISKAATPKKPEPEVSEGQNITQNQQVRAADEKAFNSERDPNKVSNKWPRSMSVQQATDIVERYQGHKTEAPPELMQAREVLSTLK